MHTALKIITGIIVIPIALLSQLTWPWWEKQSLPIKIVTGVFVLPIAGLAYATSFWWNEF